MSPDTQNLTVPQNRAKYGIVIGSKELELVNNIVKIPLNYFLLI